MATVVDMKDIKSANVRKIAEKIGIKHETFLKMERDCILNNPDELLNTGCVICGYLKALEIEGMINDIEYDELFDYYACKELVGEWPDEE